MPKFLAFNILKKYFIFDKFYFFETASLIMLDEKINKNKVGF